MDWLPARRQEAADFARVWDYGRNPAFYDYETIGGDCTNFASQCIYAGTGVMNYTPVFGWYYLDADDKAPAWTGVVFLHNFLVRKTPSPGPVCMVTQDLTMAEPGDVIQLLFDGKVFQHSPVVIDTDGSGDPAGIQVAAHSYDANCRPLNSYRYQQYRVLHILGYYSDSDEQQI